MAPSVDCLTSNQRSINAQSTLIPLSTPPCAPSTIQDQANRRPRQGQFEYPNTLIIACIQAALVHRRKFNRHPANRPYTRLLDSVKRGDRPQEQAQKKRLKALLDDSNTARRLEPWSLHLIDTDQEPVGTLDGQVTRQVPHLAKLQHLRLAPFAHPAIEQYT